MTSRPIPTAICIPTPEDILLQKLRGFRPGNEVSDRLWRDVLGILLVQGDALDRDYLRDRAGRLGLSDLLARAEAAVGRRRHRPCISRVVEATPRDRRRAASRTTGF